jgi:hypothetical protein
VKAPDVEVDTFGYDVGVVALVTLGVGVMFTNALLGGVLFIAGPALAVYVRRTRSRSRARAAKELAPRPSATPRKLGPKLEEMIQDFAEPPRRQWVVSAGEELHREVIEVLTATRNERNETARTTERP